jgi:hypothetical protein
VVLFHNKNGSYVIYDKDGKVVIITCRKDHAIEYANTLKNKSNGNQGT